MDRRSNQMSVYEGYAPEEYQLCKDAVIDQDGKDMYTKGIIRYIKN